MEARAQARYVRVTPMKARRVIDLIRGMNAADAQAVLRFAPQAASALAAAMVALSEAAGGATVSEDPPPQPAMAREASIADPHLVNECFIFFVLLNSLNLGVNL